MERALKCRTFAVMLSVQFPVPGFKIQGAKGQETIWDGIRKKWVRLTPEEWVRQNFIQYLIQQKHYPPALISIEKEIRLGEMKKRYDIAVYKEAKPWLVIECKELGVPINAKVLEQIIRYNARLTASYLVLTNGSQHFGWNIQKTDFQPLLELPDWG